MSSAQGWADPELKVSPIQPTRWLPHDYHDQAVASVKAMYPDAEIVANRRTGILSQGHVYSLLAYRIDSGVTVVQGAVILRSHAWEYSYQSAEPDLAQIEERLSRLAPPESHSLVDN